MNTTPDMPDASQTDNFREEVRAWLVENCPQKLRDLRNGSEARCWGGKQWTFDSPEQKKWLERCIERGWTAPSWPKEYGGAGLSAEQSAIIKSEMDNLNIPRPLYSYGLTMLGPTLLKYGTPAQKAMHLPAIAKGEIRWCQGYSEPNAGSDLASLSMKCEDKGDHWLLNGQKIWTSTADKSDWIFAMVRTDNSQEKKQMGISFILVDINTPGIHVRPIDLISGKSPFCETFFTDVKVPKSYGPDNSSIVGEINNGWRIGMYLLSHERGSLGAYTLDGRGHEPLSLIDMAIEEYGRNSEGQIDNPILREKLASAQIDEAACTALAEHLNTQINEGMEIGAKSSLVKYSSTQTIKKGYELRMEIAGLSGTVQNGNQDLNDTTLAQNWLYSRAYTILGGTSEIQLNIISKRLLGLPT